MHTASNLSIKLVAPDWPFSCNTGIKVTSAEISSPGARFSKVPIINGPGKLSPFTLRIEVSIVLHLTR